MQLNPADVVSTLLFATVLRGGSQSVLTDCFLGDSYPIPMGEAAGARRTQAERRDETRRQVLDATVECLIELGYARTSTLEVQKRAGVSRGALLHHFPSKAELLVAAVRYLAELRACELEERAARLPEGGDRVSAVMDLLWETSSGPLFYVAMELRTAARTDPELREVLAEEERGLRRDLLALSRELFGPRIASQPGFDEALELSVNVMMGSAMTAILHGRRPRLDAVMERWKKAFAVLVGQTERDGRRGEG